MVSSRLVITTSDKRCVEDRQECHASSPLTTVLIFGDATPVHGAMSTSTSAASFDTGFSELCGQFCKSGVCETPEPNKGEPHA